MRIAVIGSGISGMVAAHLLSDDHHVMVFEANDYIGGHTHTIDVAENGKVVPVDTGFIVFNTKTYPNFTRLMQQLDVTWQPSDMSFSVQCDKTGLYFKPSTLNSLFADRRNLLRPSFYRMLMEAIRFRSNAPELLETDEYQVTLQQYLEANNYSREFIEHFIIPMGGSIWSTDPVRFREFPARYFVEFFTNHGFLNIRNQPQWLVIKGGSRSYIEPLTRGFRDQIRLKAPVTSIRRHPDRVDVSIVGGQTDSFDQVVIATHSDQALKILSDPSDAEKKILGDIPYQENLAILHTDTSVLPPKKIAWASWNYHIPKEELGRVALTYDMNSLQSLGSAREYCVTLNLPGAVNQANIIDTFDYHHPLYTPESLVARRRQAEINGINRTYFCGAYWGFGFHEDGVKSALAVCEHFGKRL
ncbi:MAG: FAD-dependent oxidoreductase [Deltaproteobacteria bacterium SG8_13]|nr:MAG: FAD-dependent oxidoreductase [Deltaproteobacteria bacterium SG8_13]